MLVRSKVGPKPKNKSLEFGIWDAACSIRGAKDAPKYKDKRGKLRAFDRVVANPMWNQDWFTEADYDADELDRFPSGAGFTGKSSADWGWVQHMHASLGDHGRAQQELRPQQPRQAPPRRPCRPHQLGPGEEVRLKSC